MCNTAAIVCTAVISASLVGEKTDRTGLFIVLVLMIVLWIISAPCLNVPHMRLPESTAFGIGIVRDGMESTMPV